MSKNIEIERKFLVKGAFKSFATKSYRIIQGYLILDNKKSVRIRIKGEKGYITIKNKPNENGFSTFFWESEIPIKEANQLLMLCENCVIEKTRYEVPFGTKNFEVDVFHGINDGLIVAELELKNKDDSFEKPVWLGMEVTNDKRYYNTFISKNPYKNW